jgi:hypothetical protein
MWFEVDVPTDVDYMDELVRLGQGKEGFAPSKAEFKDKIPVGGTYPYTTNPRNPDPWTISGSVFVRGPADERLIKEAGDLPRLEPLDLKRYGFQRGGLAALRR